MMQSVFWPSSQIAEKFDLKGFVAGRVESGGRDNMESNNNNSNPEEEDFLIWKDGKFAGTEVNLGGSSRWFSEQLSRDVSFLRDMGAVDYSLMLGIQPSGDRDRTSSSSAKQDLKHSYAKFASAIKRCSS